MKLIDFPKQNAALDIPASLRTLADEIESGELGELTRLVWVIEQVDGEIGVGLMGKCSEPAPITYMLLGMAQRRVELGQG
jgi:hypothetical protein